TLATLPTSGGSANISGSLAPLANKWSVYAVGTRSNGQQVWSAPFTTTVDWPAQPAATNVALGGAQANVRYFNSTTVSGFNWDTSTPDVTTTFTGNDTTGSQDWGAITTGGLSITPTNIPGITFDSSTVQSLKPGYEVKCWFYAPTDDFYEVAVMNLAWANSGTASVAIDGTTLPENNYSFGPRRLSPGWHELRMRSILTVNNWTSTQVRLRGGVSQDFSLIIPSLSASMGSGSNGTTPTINSVAQSPSPATGATVTLTANATGGGGSLTYHWSLLSAPPAVLARLGLYTEALTFSATGTSQPATTVTFTQPGNYVIGLRVAGATDSAFTTVPVSVQAAAPSMVLSTNGYTSNGYSNWLRGLPLNVYAYSKDQFGRRIDITPTVPGLPTVNWTTTDPNGSFQNISANGETAQFVSTSALPADASCYITATGTNGRTGSAYSYTSFATNLSPTAYGSAPFTITKPANSNALVFTALSSIDPESFMADPYLQSPLYPAVLTSFQWSVVSTPPGGTLALSGNDTQRITGVPSAPGAYVLRLTVTDQAGATLSQTMGFYVNADGSTTSPYRFSRQKLKVGETVFVSTNVLKGSGETYQMQTSADGGTTWQSCNSTVQSYADIDDDGILDPDYDQFIMTYGPVTMADDNRLFRIDFTKGGVTTIGVAGKITVSATTANRIRIKEVMSLGGKSTTYMPENAGSMTFTLTRTAGSSGAASADWVVYYDTSELTGTATWADGDNSDRPITIPIVNDNIPIDQWISFQINSATGAIIWPGSSSLDVGIVDDDNAGTAAFLSSSASVLESAGSVSLPVRRSGPFKGPLTVNYSTEAITALAGQDFTAVNGTLTWADGDTTDKQIVVPILSDNLVEGDEQFKVTLTEPVGTTPTTLGSTTVCTVTVKDAPYQQWQKAQWPASVPTVAIYSDYAVALKAMSPMVQFPLNETSGTLVAGLDANGTTVATGTLTNNGAGNYTLGQAGPRPLLWPGLPSTNTAVSFTTGTSVTGTPPYFTSNGASLNCGTANGLGSKLGSGFTVSMFIKTSITNREMIIAGGKRAGTNPNAFFVSLNRLNGATSTATPHAVRIYMAPQEANATFDYSVVFENTPTGSICDGQWHHLAITVPPFSDPGSLNNPRFYFDGEEVNALDVRGSESIGSSATFSDFSDTGFRLGADGSATPIKFFNGALDEFCFFSRELTATEIADLCAAEPPTTPPAYMAAAANPTGDGVPNLMKYAFGLNPRTAYTGPLTDTEIVDDRLSLIFSRLRDATDITYRVQASSDLVNWTNIWSSATDPYPGGLSPSVLLSVPDTEVIGAPGIAKRFLRLQVTQP
ncbi:MAG: Calx-beta domain-containing protein, partial [Verrucomicrobiota bacterium]